jgi:acyl transferase domain-containing protein
MEKVASSNTSVYASGFNHDHLVNWASDMDSKLRYKATGATNSMISNRVSWFFDLKGASVTLDTACSSSMVAFHLACQGLATREADMVSRFFRVKSYFLADSTRPSLQG